MTSHIFVTVRELGEELRSGSVSPTDLTELFLARLEEHGPKLNAVAHLTRKRAMKLAKKAEIELKKGKIRSPLHGIPWGAKDLLATKGYPTSWGAAPFKDRVLPYDAAVVEKLDKSGAVLLAKLAMIELAGGMVYKQPNACWTGPCRTPWSMSHWSGGSSSGSGSAVSSGLVPFAIGSETWGSILSPANNCGVSGLRPTYGRVSRRGAMALSWTLDKIGPLCQTADDCGLVFESIVGSDVGDPSTTKRKYRYELSKGPFKVAVLKNAVEGAEDAVASNYNAAIKVVEKYATVEEVTFPDFPYDQITRTILNSEAVSAFEEFLEDGLSHKLTAPEDHYGSYSRFGVLAVDYLRALRLRGKVVKIAETVMKPYDAVLAPTSKRTAAPIDQEFKRNLGNLQDIMGAIGNGAGLPSVSVPSGFDSQGLPTGIQFMGRSYDENRILSVAVEYQLRTGWHKKHPKDFIPRN
jgi:aspartyl-tRNA(Asn)/glutamyl-tRNA(Gln) amidotransferase subunit A